MKITPTVGRIVWYWPWNAPDTNIGIQDDKFVAHIDRQPLPAIVTGVLDEGHICVTVFDIAGILHGRGVVALIQDGDERPTHMPYCEWMPYQKQVAASQAALSDSVSGGPAPVDAVVGSAAIAEQTESPTSPPAELVGVGNATI